MLLEKLPPSIPMPDQWYGKLTPYEVVVVAHLLYHSGQRWDGQSEPAEVWDPVPPSSNWRPRC